MRRFRIAVLGSSPCWACSARCCKQNGHEYAVLLEEDERRKFAPWAIDLRVRPSTYDLFRQDRMEKVLPYRDGACPFLGSDDRCTIYEDRPSNCRKFECVRAFHLQGADSRHHGAFLQRNRDVLELLEEL